MNCKHRATITGKQPVACTQRCVHATSGPGIGWKTWFVKLLIGALFSNETLISGVGCVVNICKRTKVEKLNTLVNGSVHIFELKTL